MMAVVALASGLQGAAVPAPPRIFSEFDYTYTCDVHLIEGTTERVSGAIRRIDRSFVQFSLTGESDAVPAANARTSSNGSGSQFFLQALRDDATYTYALKIKIGGGDGYLTVSKLIGNSGDPRYIGTGLCRVHPIKAANS